MSGVYPAQLMGICDESREESAAMIWLITLRKNTAVDSRIRLGSELRFLCRFDDTANNTIVAVSVIAQTSCYYLWPSNC